MAADRTIRMILPDSKAFKNFWDHNGPYRYALSSREFPPVLLAQEEWIFSNDVTLLLKELMRFDQNKMKFVKTDFNTENKAVLRPDKLSHWKIHNFPEEWNITRSDYFIPEGHLTMAVMEQLENKTDPVGPSEIEKVFFKCLEKDIDQLGYVLFRPRGNAKRAAIQKYLKEWEQDDMDAGI